MHSMVMRSYNHDAQSVSARLETNICSSRWPRRYLVAFRRQWFHLILFHILSFFDIIITYCRCKDVVCRCFITVFLFELYVDDSIKVTRKTSQTNLTKTRNKYAKIDYERPSKPTSRQTVQFAPLHIAEYCGMIRPWFHVKIKLF